MRARTGKPQWTQAKTVPLGLHAFRYPDAPPPNPMRSSKWLSQKTTPPTGDSINGRSTAWRSPMEKCMSRMFHLRQGKRYRTAHAQRQRRHSSHPSASPQLRVDAHRREADGGRHEGCRHGSGVTRKWRSISWPTIPASRCSIAISSCTWISASWRCSTMPRWPPAGGCVVPPGPVRLRSVRYFFLPCTSGICDDSCTSIIILMRRSS